MRRFKRFRDYFFFWSLVYLVIIIIGWLFLGSLRLFRVIRVHNKQLVPKRPQSLILISNHPSFWEPFFLHCLFVRAASINPVKFFPYSAPDLKNFNKWYWTAFKARFIFFPRGNKRGCALAQARALRVLKRGRILIIFPEGGRTSTNSGKGWLISTKGHKLRPLKSGASRLALQSGCDILPVWVKGAERAMPRGSKLPRFWRRVDVIVGETFRIKGEDSKENLEKAKDEMTKRLLALADQEV